MDWRARKTVLALIMALAPTAATAAAPSAVDVPTWQVGDRWLVKQSFNLGFSTTTPIALSFSLPTTETYRLIVSDLADRATTSSGVVRVYRRMRSSGLLSGSGQFSSGSLTINFRWREPVSVTTGQDWISESDLSRVHEFSRLNGTLEARLGPVWLDLATVTLDLTVDSKPPREEADFPIATVGERWLMPVRQRAYGRFQVAWNPSFPWPGGRPSNLSQSFDTTTPIMFTYRYTGREARGGHPQTYHIQAYPGASLWYEPSIKEYAEVSGDSLDFGRSSRLQNLKTVITSSTVAADPPIMGLQFAPSRPTQGQQVLVMGSATPNASVSAIVIGDRFGSSGLVPSTGFFMLMLRAPRRNDNSPSTDDGGSFGVEVTVQGMGRKVVTLQLYLPPASARRGWQLYR